MSDYPEANAKEQRKNSGRRKKISSQESVATLIIQGHRVVLDRADLLRVSKHTWHVTEGRTGKLYVRRSDRPHPYMHRQILGLKARKPGVDHKNRDGLDNRRSNLRLCTQSQNNGHIVKFRGTYSSRHKGVSWCKDANKWRARIRVPRMRQHLGYFRDEDEAARAYNVAATEAFGEFALLNTTTKRRK